MEKKFYILLSILFGWAVFFIFPIQEPALTYFLGIIIGTLSLFYIPYKKYTHNIYIQVPLWVVMLSVFPIYFFAGLAVGIGTHIALDRLKNIVKDTKLGFYQQWTFSMFLVLINFLTVTGYTIEKFMNY